MITSAPKPVLRMATQFKLGFTALYLLSALPAAADALQDGAAAYSHGEYSRALRLLKPLAVHGDAYAEITLGLIYAKGQGVAQDDAQAAAWYRKSADKGNAFAQTNLALFLAQGRGVKQDYTEAAKYYRKAAAQGVTFAATESRWALCSRPGREEAGLCRGRHLVSQSCRKRRHGCAGKSRVSSS